MPRTTVLVVEDELLLLSSIMDELEDRRFSVLGAADGAKAIGMIYGATRIDALLTDIRLPGSLDGWHVAQVARQRFPALPIVYTTGFAPDPGRPVEDGVMLRKPYTADDLVRTFEKLGVKPTR